MAIIDGYPATSFDAKDRAWVKAVADNSAGEVLPDVTAADNGKILGVASGEWNKVDAPSGLPSVTAADNGKLLGVSEGSWTKVDAPSGGGNNAFMVTVTTTIDGVYTIFTGDKSWNDIKTAILAGKQIIFYYDNTYTEDDVTYTSLYWSCGATISDYNDADGRFYLVMPYDQTWSVTFNNGFKNSDPDDPIECRIRTD